MEIVQSIYIRNYMIWFDLESQGFLARKVSWESLE